MYENIAIEKCTECHKEMDIRMHNYGTPEYPCCIHCYNLANGSFEDDDYTQDFVDDLRDGTLIQSK